METDLRELIEGAISKFSRNRTGPGPKIMAEIPTELPRIFWQDDALAKFIKCFLYHALVANSPELPIQVSVHARSRLTDLEGFVGVFPLCWIQLRILGHGPSMTDGVVEELFSEFGYRCEEWVGVQDSEAQLAIFSPLEKEGPKMVFCVDGVRTTWKCDLLIPASEQLLLPAASSARRKQ